MSSTTPLTDSINNLTTYANSVTGASDTNLSDAVATLASGYGGGGGSGKWSDDDIAARSYTGDIVVTGTKIVETAFRGSSITSISGENVTDINSSNIFRDCEQLTSVNFPMVTSMGTYCFYGCSSLQSINLPKLNGVGGWAFENCSSLATAVFAKSGGPTTRSFANCTSLRAVDFGISCPTLGSNNTFNNASVLKVVIIRNTGRVVTCGNINIFTGTPFASDGTGGTFYVPSALISSYQSATNWSTILGYSTNSIQAIEGSIYETQYADGTPIT